MAGPQRITPEQLRAIEENYARGNVPGAPEPERAPTITEMGQQIVSGRERAKSGATSPTRRTRPESLTREQMKAIEESASKAPTHKERLEESLGMPVRDPEGWENAAIPVARGVAGTLADTAEGRAKVADFLIRSINPKGAAFVDPHTGMPVMRTPQGEIVPLDTPGIGWSEGGLSETAGELAEIGGMGTPANIGARYAGKAAVKRAARGASQGVVPWAVGVGATSMEGLRQFVGEVTGLDDETLNEMIASVGFEAFGQIISTTLPHFVRGTARATGMRVDEAGQRALEAEARLKAEGFDYGLTPAEMSSAIANRFAKQIALLSSRAQEFFGNRALRLSAMLRDLPDPAQRGMLRDHIERTFTEELDTQTSALLEAASVSRMSPEDFKKFRPRYRKAIMDYRVNSQKEVSALYDESDELMAASGTVPDYFPEIPGGKGDVLSASVTASLANNPRMEPKLKRILDDIYSSIEDARKKKVRGLVTKTRNLKDPLRPDVEIVAVQTPREQLQKWATELYDVSANPNIDDSMRKEARRIRSEVFDVLENPVYKPIPGREYRPELAQEAIDTHERARAMARSRFDHLEQLEALGVTEYNAEPIETVKAILESKNRDRIFAIAKLEGGMGMVRDVFFTDIMQDPQTIGKKLLEMPQEVLLEIVDNDPTRLGNMMEAARRADALERTGAWQALKDQTGSVGFARQLLFGKKSASRQELWNQLTDLERRQPGMMAAAEDAVIAELMYRSTDYMQPGELVKPEIMAKQLAQLEREGMLEFVSPRVRSILRDSTTLAQFTNMFNPDAGTGLEVASTAARLRSANIVKFMSAVGEIGFAEAAATLVTSPRGMDIYMAAARVPDPILGWDLSMSALGTAAVQASREASRDTSGNQAEEAGVQ